MNYQPIPRELQKLKLDLVSFDDDHNKRSYIESKQAFLNAIAASASENSIQVTTSEIYELISQGEQGIERLWQIIGGKPLLPLSLIVAYSETQFMTGHESITDFQRFFGNGLVQNIFKETLRIENEVAPRNINFISENQSSDKYRSVIELASNAVDFSEDDSMVEIETSDEGYKIRDYGRGMNEYDLMFKLPVPYISGARNANKLSIGKFGLGFYTAVGDLKQNGDSIVIKTSMDGEKGLLMKYVYINGEIYIQYDYQQEVLQGTEITVNIQDYDSEKANSNLKKFLKEKRGPKILLNNKTVNSLRNYSVVEDTENKNENTALLYKLENKKQLPTSEFKILVNGVMVEKVNISGSNLPASLSIDLPYNTEISEDRIHVKYDEFTRNSIKKLLDQILESNIDFETKIKILNGFGQLTLELEKRSKIENGSENLTQNISEFIRKEAAERNLIVVGDTVTLQNLSIANKLKVNDRILGFNPAHIQNAELISEFSGHSHIAYLVDFEEGNEIPLVIYKHYILVDRKAWELQKGDPLFFEIYLNQREKNFGTFVYKKSNEETRFTEQELLPENVYENFIKFSDSTFRQFALRQGFEFDNIIRYFGDFKEVDKIWKNQPKFSKAYLEKLAAFLAGEIGLEELNLANQDENPHYTEVLNTPGWQQLLVNLRKFYSFFDTENVAKLMKLNPEERFVLIKNHLIECTNIFPEKFINDLKTGYVIIPGDEDRDKEDRKMPLESMQDILQLLKTFDYRWIVKNDKEDLQVGMMFTFVEDVAQLYGSLEEYEKIVSSGNVDVPLLNKYLRMNSSHFPHFYISSAEEFAKVIPRHDPEFLNKLFDHLEPLFGTLMASDYNMDLILYLLTSPKNFLVDFTKIPMGKDKNDDTSNYVDRKKLDDKDTMIDDLMKDNHFVDPATNYQLSKFFDSIVKRPHIFPEELRQSAERIQSILDEIDHLQDQRFYLRRENEEKAEEYRIQILAAGKKARAEFGTFHTLFYQFAENLRDSTIANSGTIFQNIDKLTTLPAVQQCHALNRSHFNTIKYRISNNGDPYTIEPKQYLLLDAEELVEFNQDYFHELDEDKLEVISQTIEEHFNSEVPTLGGYTNFLVYLRRVLRLGDLSLEEFKRVQPLLVFAMTDEHTRRDRSQTPVMNFLRNHTPASVYTADVLKEIANSKIPQGKMIEFARFFDNIYDSDDKEYEKMPFNEKLKRAITIWETISELPHSEYEDITYEFSRSYQTKYESSVNYGAFNISYLGLQKLPEIIRPYVIFYRDGETLNLESSRDQIEMDVYGHSNLLSEISLARKLKSKTFMDKTQNIDEFNEWISQTSEGKQNLLIRRGLIHSIYHQSVSDPNIFLRELIQNSYEEILKNGGGGTINIDEFIEQDNYIVQIADPGGMTFETIMAYLLPYEYSNKTIDDIGKFGIGFLSIFQGAEKVCIKTNRDGKTVFLKITPVLDSSQHIIDLQVEYDEYEDDSFKGTVIQKYMKNEGKKMQSAFLESSVIKFGGYLDPEIARIEFNKNTVNDNVETIASRNSISNRVYNALRSGDSVMTQSGLYVSEIPERFMDVLPDTIKNTLIDSGFCFDIDKSIPLTRTRDAVGRFDDYAPDMETAFVPLAFDYFLTLFSQDEVSYQYLPYDYMWEKMSHEIPTDKEFTTRDAKIINNGGLLDDYSKYFDEDNLMYLLTQIKFIDYNDEKLSLYDLSQMIKLKLPIDREELPYKIAILVGTGKNKIEMEEYYQQRLKQEQIEEMEDFTLEGLNSQQIEYIKENSDTYLAFIEFMQMITPDSLGNVTHTYYFQADTSLAHATSFFSMKGWNLNSFNTAGEREVSNWDIFQFFSDVIKRKPFKLLESDKRILLRLLDTSTHEDTHIYEQSEHITHNSRFYNDQKKIIADAIYSGVDIENSLRVISEKYTGRLVPPLQLVRELKALAA